MFTNQQMTSGHRRRGRGWSPARGGAWLLGAATALVAILSTACSSPGARPASSPGGCQRAAVKVVVTTNVWGSVVDQVAGPCAQVTTIVSSQAADPHEFEPTAATAATFGAADLAVMNGLGYDPWAMKIVDALGPDAPQVLDLGTSLGLAAGANPHIWYSPDYVQRSAAAVTRDLKRLAPESAEQFDLAAADFVAALRPYLDEVASVRARHAGTPVGATESLFAYMAQATGLRVTTPEGLLRAEANGSEPSPRDIQLASEQLADGTDRALVFNVQTDGALPRQLREQAESHDVPVVDITETLVPADATFQAWQIAQLQSLSRALGG